MTSGCLCKENRAHTCGTRVPHVARRLGVEPRPADRRCRSGFSGRGREQPPSPKARCGVAASVFSHPRHRLRGCSRTRDPLREGHARRHERDGLTGAATSDSEPGHPMGTADPRRHRRPRRVRRSPGRHPAIREPLRERGPVRGRRGGAPRRPRRGHMECGPSTLLAKPRGECHAEGQPPGPETLSISSSTS